MPPVVCFYFYPGFLQSNVAAVGFSARLDNQGSLANHLRDIRSFRIKRVVRAVRVESSCWF